MEHLNNDGVIYTNISGEAAQHRAASSLCSDCCGILQRVLELESGEPKFTLFGWKDQRKWAMRRARFGSNVPETGRKYGESAIFLSLPEDNSMPHKSDRAELISTSLHGCLMCTWLVQSLNSRSHLTNGDVPELWLKRPASIGIKERRSFLSNRCTSHYHLVLRCPAPPPALPSIVPFQERELRTFIDGKLCRPSARQPWPHQMLRGDEVASLLIDVMPSSSSSQDLLSSLMNLEQETPSSATWNLFHSWLDTCDRDHPECKGSWGNTSPCSPTRLVDIQSANTVRIVESSTIIRGERSHSLRYATLSHCWGTIHEPQLNKDTAKTLKQGIPLEELPSLYHDAVILARHLKIQYMWIDSLCILQDSTDDWRRESAKMGSIYENSYICIAASAAIDNSIGFLKRHSADWPQPLVHGNLIINAELYKQPSNLAMRQPGWCDRIRTLLDWGVDGAPLNQRAWVLQERMFAPRIIHCTSDEFVWECGRGIRSESHVALTSGGSMVKDIWKEIYYSGASLLKQPAEHLDLGQKASHLERWSQIIGLFSSLKITFPRDRLPAISAVAKRFQPILGEYTAGLWKDFMPSQLLWRHPNHLQCKRNHILEENSAPSWTWSTLDCDVVLPYYKDENSEDFPCAVSRSTEMLLDISSPTYVNILKTKVELDGEDITGMVKSGRIDLTGPLFPVYESAAFGYLPGTQAPPMDDPNMSIHWDWDDIKSHGLEQYTSLRHETMKPISRFSSRENTRLFHKLLLSIHSPILTKMCCLPVLSGYSSNRASSDPFIRGLVLESVEDVVGVYQRVGHFECSYTSFKWFTESEPDAAVPLTDEWPSRLEYSFEEGFTICII